MLTIIRAAANAEPDVTLRLQVVEPRLPLAASPERHPRLSPWSSTPGKNAMGDFLSPDMEQPRVLPDCFSSAAQVACVQACGFRIVFPLRIDTPVLRRHAEPEFKGSQFSQLAALFVWKGRDAHGHVSMFVHASRFPLVSSLHQHCASDSAEKPARFTKDGHSVDRFESYRWSQSAGLLTIEEAFSVSEAWAGAGLEPTVYSPRSAGLRIGTGPFPFD